LITAGDIGQITKAQGGVAGHEVLIDDLIIPAVEQAFAKYCNRDDFDQKSRTEIFSIQQPTAILQVSSPPIAAAPAVQLWQDTATPRAYGSTTELVNGTDFFVLESVGQIVKEGSCFASGLKTVKVTYTGGWLTGDGAGVPASLKLAAMIQALGLFERRGEYFLTSRSQEGSISMLTPLMLPKNVTILLDEFRVFRSAA